MCAFVIVDPGSCGGRQSRGWRLLESELAKRYPYMSLAFPRRRSEMTALVAAALRDGHTEIVAVGGGTMDETVNGFFDAEGALSPDAVLTVLASGKDHGGIAKLSKAAVRPIDVGRASYLSPEGKPRTRYFATMASVGVLAESIHPMRHSLLAELLRRHSGLNHLFGLFDHRGRAVRLMVDQSFDDIVTIRAVAIANGRIFGTTMALAPDAKPDDGQFDVVIMAHGGPQSGARLIHGRKIVAAPVEETRGRPVPVALDGHSVGRLPATFEILPRALNVRC